MRGETAATLLTIVSVLFGCSPERSKAERGIATVRDSAGIRIVESPSPLWEPSDAWMIDPIPVRTIGNADFDPTRALYFVNRALILEDGRTVVANAGASELLWFDAEGALERVVGGQGDGPGEFRSIYDLFRCNGDSLLVKSFNRISVFDADGSFVSTTPLEQHAGDGYLEFQGVTQDCSKVLIRSEGRDVLKSVNTEHVTHTLYWTSLDGDQRDTITTVDGIEVARTSDGGIVAVPWGFEGIWVVGRDRVYIGLSKLSEIKVYNQGAELIEVIRWGSDPMPVAAEDRQLYAEKRRERIGDDPNARRYIKPLEEVPSRSTKPAYSRFLVDDEANLWVREYPASAVGLPYLFDRDPNDAPEAWTVFDPLGQMLGVVLTPPRLNVHSIQDGLVVGVWKDEFDVEQVRMHRLRKNDAE